MQARKQGARGDSCYGVNNRDVQENSEMKPVSAEPDFKDGGAVRLRFR